MKRHERIFPTILWTDLLILLLQPTSDLFCTILFFIKRVTFPHFLPKAVSELEKLLPIETLAILTKIAIDKDRLTCRSDTVS